MSSPFSRPSPRLGFVLKFGGNQPWSNAANWHNNCAGAAPAHRRTLSARGGFTSAPGRESPIGSSCFYIDGPERERNAAGTGAHRRPRTVSFAARFGYRAESAKFRSFMNELREHGPHRWPNGAALTTPNGARARNGMGGIALTPPLGRNSFECPRGISTAWVDARPGLPCPMIAITQRNQASLLSAHL